MKKNDCEELVRRFRIEKEIEALRSIPTIRDSGLFDLLLDFHRQTVDLITGYLFVQEYSTNCKTLSANLKLSLEALHDRLSEQEVRIFDRNLESLLEIYGYWWTTTDLPAPKPVLKAIAEQVFLVAEFMSRSSECPEFKRLAVELARDFGIDPQKQSAPSVGRVRTFVLTHNFFKYLEAFNDFERSLRKAALISEDTRKAALRAAFRDEGVLEKVRWTGRVSELSYMIKGLVKEGIVQDPGQEIWRVTLDCFEILSARGKTFQEIRRSLREAKKPSEARRQVIDRIVAHLRVG